MNRWNAYKDYLISRYGCSVYRIGVDGGFSCPNRCADRSGGCVFCDGLGASATYARTAESRFTRSSGFLSSPPQSDSQVSGLSLDERIRSIAAQIERGRAFIRQRYDSEQVSLYFQAYSNTYAPVGELKQIFDGALAHGPFREFIVSTRPDCFGPGVLELLESFRDRVDEVSIELGLQSGSDRILGLMNRGHDVKCFLDAARQIHERGFRICSHVILGFPGETREDLDQTIRVVNESGIEAVKVHNLHITAQSRLLEQYYQGEVTAGSIERHLENVVYFLRRIRDDIVIERLMCETPSHRLAAPRNFPDKTIFLKRLDGRLGELGAVQGDLCRRQ